MKRITVELPDDLYVAVANAASLGKVTEGGPRSITEVVVGLIRSELGRGGDGRSSGSGPGGRKGVIPKLDIPKPPDLGVVVGEIRRVERDMERVVGVPDRITDSTLGMGSSKEGYPDEIFDPETVFGKPAGTGGKSGKSRVGGKPMPEGLSTSQRAKWMRENGGGR